jgi:hypothetical protein
MINHIIYVFSEAIKQIKVILLVSIFSRNIKYIFPSHIRAFQHYFKTLSRFLILIQKIQQNPKIKLGISWHSDVNKHKRLLCRIISYQVVSKWPCCQLIAQSILHIVEVSRNREVVFLNKVGSTLGAIGNTLMLFVSYSGAVSNWPHISCMSF